MNIFRPLFRVLAGGPLGLAVSIAALALALAPHAASAQDYDIIIRIGRLSVK